MLPGAHHQITCIAVGVDNYQHVLKLNGPSRDVRRLKKLLVESQDTALYEESQFVSMIDPRLDQLASVINDYVSYADQGDILVFYFSGHGVPIGHNDFGLCTVDTIAHPGSGSVLPLSVMKFSDLLRTLSIANITPIIIIDACFSGIAGRTQYLTAPVDVISNMRDELHNTHASKYALLCSCSESQLSIDTPSGGLFSKRLVKVARAGLDAGRPMKPTLRLHDIFPQLEEAVSGQTGGQVTPRLYIGPMLPDFPLVRNVLYTPLTYSLTGHLLKVLAALWNDGNTRELSASEIRDCCGNGAYGNHNKLSLPPWALVDDNPGTRKRRLTKRGKAFMQGKLKLPRTIETDALTGEYVPASGAPLVDWRSAWAGTRSGRP